jgi:catechol 2,3-dioxygenase-like lactoylglutathione lyase family enzyme
MITGCHVILYSKEAARTRAFFRDVLGLKWIEMHGGWLIFGLPPSEMGIHPDEGGGRHELYLMCDDIEKTCAELRAKGVVVGPVSEQPWGLLAEIDLPGAGALGVYEPRHPTMIRAAAAGASRKRPAKPRAAKKKPKKRPKRGR